MYCHRVYILLVDDFYNFITVFLVIGAVVVKRPSFLALSCRIIYNTRERIFIKIKKETDSDSFLDVTIKSYCSLSTISYRLE